MVFISGVEVQAIINILPTSLDMIIVSHVTFRIAMTTEVLINVFTTQHVANLERYNSKYPCNYHLSGGAAITDRKTTYKTYKGRLNKKDIYEREENSS